MDVSISFYLAAALSIVVTGLSKSGFGGGLGVMAVPIMSLFAPPQVAAAVLMPILISMDVLIVLRYRKDWDRAVVLTLIPGAAVGLGIGAVFFGTLDADIIRFAVGILAATFVIQYLVQGRAWGQSGSQGRTIVWTLGFISGFASYIAHAGGPPVKGYLLSQNMPKSRFVGTNTAFFFVLNVVKTIAYGSTGTMDWSTLEISLLLSPMLFIGVLLGMWLHAKVDQRFFVRVVYGFLALTALRLLWTSVPSIVN